jgi:hypothetical protein
MKEAPVHIPSAAALLPFLFFRGGAVSSFADGLGDEEEAVEFDARAAAVGGFVGVDDVNDDGDDAGVVEEEEEEDV